MRRRASLSRVGAAASLIIRRRRPSRSSADFGGQQCFCAAFGAQTDPFSYSKKTPLNYYIHKRNGLLRGKEVFAPGENHAAVMSAVVGNNCPLIVRICWCCL